MVSVKLLLAPRCPHVDHRDCRLCGQYLGWIDLDDPARGPTAQEWADAVSQMQARHDRLRDLEFQNLKLEGA